MSLMDRLEKRFGRHAFEDVTTSIVAVQVLVFGLLSIQKISLADLYLIPVLVGRGEIWRLVSFLVIPPSTHPLFMVFALYIFWLMGSALENHWGAFRYNLFLGIAWLATVGFGMFMPWVPATNTFIGTSVFLAFAWLYPEFEFRLFFLFPVQVRWLALVAWISYALAFWAGDWTTRLGIFASVANFVVFFAGDIWLLTRSFFRRTAYKVSMETAPTPRRRCRTCGIDEKSHPDGDFRFCSKCVGQVCYCEVHLQDHVHVTVARDASTPSS